jgi:DNA-binding MarR family transcriptional regulator
MSTSRQQVSLAVKRLQHRHHRAINRGLAPLNLSLVQWDTLRHLSEHPDASQHQLAELTFQTDQSFGSLESRMVERGLIERVPGPGRAILHRLTPEGERLRVLGSKVVDEVVAESLGHLSQRQLDSLGSLLDLALGDTSA